MIGNIRRHIVKRVLSIDNGLWKASVRRRSHMAGIIQWINEKVEEGRGMVQFGMTEEGDVGVWIRGEHDCVGRGASIEEAIEHAMRRERLKV